jgi:hypothetical protein
MTEEVEVSLTDEELLVLAKAAHRQDITLNQLINNILREEMNKELKTDGPKKSFDEIYKEIKERGFYLSEKDKFAVFVDGYSYSIGKDDPYYDDLVAERAREELLK